MSLGAALVALLLSILLGAPLWGLVLPIALWLGAWPVKGLRRILLLVAAPVALAALTPIHTVKPLVILQGVALAALSLVPLFHQLGGHRPPARGLLRLALALAAAAALLLTPAGAALLGSDLALGAATVALAAGALTTVPPGASRKA